MTDRGGNLRVVSVPLGAVRQHHVDWMKSYAAGTAKACADAWTLGDALRAAGGDLEAALERCEHGQLELDRQLLARTRDTGDRSQFTHRWIPGDPSLRFGIYGPGN